jgi:hypothetical protein
MKKFLTDFAEQFFQSKKTHKSPVHLFLEECQTYIPQDKSDREDPLMLNRWERLIKFFRNYGGGTSMISQQPQSVNKKCLNLADTLFAMRTIGSHERKAIMSWVKDVVESEVDLVATLPKLPTGTAHIWSPSWLGISRNIKILPKTTFDAGKTPEMGVDAIEPKPLTPVDVEQLRAEMAEMIEKVKQDDPKALRGEIARLQRELKQSSGGRERERVVEKERIVKVADPEAVRVAIAARDDDWTIAMMEFRKKTVEVLEKMVFNAPRKAKTPIAPPVNYEQKQYGVTLSVDRKTGVGTFRNNADGGPLPKGSSNGTDHAKLRAGAERMLTALVQWSPEGMRVGQMRSHAGMKKSGTFTTYMSDLRKGGYIEERGGMVFATDAGMQYFGGNVPDAPRSTEEVLAVWEPKLRDGARRILRVLVDAGGDAVPLDELTDKSGMTKSGTFTTYLSDLRTARLIVTERGVAAANKETLFL